MSLFRCQDYSPPAISRRLIETLVLGVKNGIEEQVLWASPAPQDYTMAKVIEQLDRPALIRRITRPGGAALHRVTGIFTDNAWNISSRITILSAGGYIPHTDTFIEKDAPINEEIDRLRLSATLLLERRDVIWCPPSAALRPG